MNPLKILYDYQVFAAQKYGGVSRLFYELIQNLLPKKEIELYLFHGLYINRFPMWNFKREASYYFGYKVPPLPHIPALLKPINRVLFHVLAGKSVDIYHPTGYSSIVSNWKKSPVVLTVYDMIPELFPNDFPDIKSRLKNKQKCIARADRIISISQTTKQELIHFYNVEDAKVSVVYPGAPAETTGAEEKQSGLYKYEADKQEKPYILYVGTRKQGYKNFHNLLLAYAISQKIHKEYDFICFGGPTFTRAEYELLSLLECLDNVYHLTGNDRDLARLYTGAATFVYPSFHEGFGLPPLEAMAYGCPVITGNIPIIKEVLGDAAAYFDPAEPESIVSTLETVLFDEPLRLDFIEKGKKQVKKYSWSQMAEEILKVYQSIS